MICCDRNQIRSIIWKESRDLRECCPGFLFYLTNKMDFISFLITTQTTDHIMDPILNRITLLSHAAEEYFAIAAGSYA